PRPFGAGVLERLLDRPVLAAGSGGAVIRRHALDREGHHGIVPPGTELALAKPLEGSIDIGIIVDEVEISFGTHGGRSPGWGGFGFAGARASGKILEIPVPVYR